MSADAAHECPPLAPANIERLLHGDAQLAAQWLNQLAADEHLGPADAAARAELQSLVQFVAAALGAPELFVATKPTLTADDCAALADFWRRRVDEQVMAQTWSQWESYSRLLKQRVEIPHGRMWAGRFIRTDLYLTGPPFPGPR